MTSPGRVRSGSSEQLLLTLHTLLRWLAEPARISAAAHAALSDPMARISVSAASGWKIASKVQLGNVPAATELLVDPDEILRVKGFESRPVDLHHVQHAGIATIPHLDPSDRPPVSAMAQLEGPTQQSNDPALRAAPQDPSP